MRRLLILLVAVVAFGHVGTAQASNRCPNGAFNFWNTLPSQQVDFNAWLGCSPDFKSPYTVKVYKRTGFTPQGQPIWANTFQGSSPTPVWLNGNHPDALMCWQIGGHGVYFSSWESNDGSGGPGAYIYLTTPTKTIC